MKDIRIAVAVTRSTVGNPGRNLDEMGKWIREAKRAHVDLICFPEMNVTGYWHQDPVRDTAEQIPGPISERVVGLAVEERIVILSGMAEKDSDGNVFASHLVAKPDGTLETYRKIHVSPLEKTVFSAGSNAPVFKAAGVRFGIQLCYDAHFPELSTRMALEGAEILFMPHASPRGTAEEKLASWMRHLPARAYDNSLFVVACNPVGDNGKGLNFPGVALVIGPSGYVLKKRIGAREELLTAELRSFDLDHVRKHPMRFFLPNRRPEVCD
jgi:N-carbamoylputrescine amidase